MIFFFFVPASAIWASGNLARQEGFGPGRQGVGGRLVYPRAETVAQASACLSAVVQIFLGIAFAFIWS